VPLVPMKLRQSAPMESGERFYRRINTGGIAAKDCIWPSPTGSLRHGSSVDCRNGLFVIDVKENTIVIQILLDVADTLGV
jgi:hypothetical protein